MFNANNNNNERKDAKKNKTICHRLLDILLKAPEK
jgi:hypothetical protein